MTVIDSRLLLAPMAGGPGTVDLAVAVARGGGFPMLPAGYLDADTLTARICELRGRLGDAPYGVNLFVPQRLTPEGELAAREYAAVLAPWAAKAGVELGVPRADDDAFRAKVEVVVRERVPVVSTVFAWPSAEVVDLLRAADTEVWVTVNQVEEVDWAEELGVSGLVAQGWEAGGHRGGPVDTGEEQPGTAALVAGVRGRTALPLVAAGGVMTPAHVHDLVAAGADAVQCGTAYLLAPEAGTTDLHRHALLTRSGTVVTRAFTGRSARALATMWTDLYDEAAPAAYPHVHHLTRPLRTHGTQTGQEDLVHLWAGTGHELARPDPAEETTARLLG